MRRSEFDRLGQELRAADQTFREALERSDMRGGFAEVLEELEYKEWDGERRTLQGAVVFTANPYAEGGIQFDVAGWRHRTTAINQQIHIHLADLTVASLCRIIELKEAFARWMADEADWPRSRRPPEDFRR